MPRSPLFVALLLIAVATALRLAWAAALPVSTDEAYHWLYTVHPDVSYFDHPPMTMLVAKAGIALCGGVGSPVLPAARLRAAMRRYELVPVPLDRPLLRRCGRGVGATRIQCQPLPDSLRRTFRPSGLTAVLLLGADMVAGKRSCFLVQSRPQPRAMADRRRRVWRSDAEQVLRCTATGGAWCCLHC